MYRDKLVLGSKTDIWKSSTFLHLTRYYYEENTMADGWKLSKHGYEMNAECLWRIFKGKRTQERLKYRWEYIKMQG